MVQYHKPYYNAPSAPSACSVGHQHTVVDTAQQNNTAQQSINTSHTIMHTRATRLYGVRCCYGSDLPVLTSTTSNNNQTPSVSHIRYIITRNHVTICIICAFNKLKSCIQYDSTCKQILSDMNILLYDEVYTI